jgi:hypothetical protein
VDGTADKMVVARVWLAIAASMFAAACTTLPGPPLLRDAEGCMAWAATLDGVVAASGVADAEAERIAGVPGLRVDRPGQALIETALRNDAAWTEWLARSAQLDRSARAAEILNLPSYRFPLRFDDGIAAIVVPDRPAALGRTDRCRDLAVQQMQSADSAATDAAPVSARDALAARAVMPDRYSTTSRALGLYPLLRWPFFDGVQAWQDEHAAVMRRWAEAPPALQRHLPDPWLAISPTGEGEPAPLTARNAIGLLQLSPADEQRLLGWHAPLFEIEELGAFDRFGTPTWPSRDAAAPRVDTTRPVVYTRVAHTRFDGQWRLQLVYTLWFPERPARASFDLLAGTLDGVIVRLTLDDDGEPLLMDTIHACGCYHLFFPAPALRARGSEPPHEEWLFAPAALPAVGRDARLVVRLASGTHYVSGLAAQPRGSAQAITPERRYTLRDENELRSLALAGAPAERRSLYGPDGLVPGSERGERFLFWPMGIASAGAMRQWGHHATAFVGRRHFDDVDLIEQRFVRAAAPRRTEP